MRNMRDLDKLSEPVEPTQAIVPVQPTEPQLVLKGDPSKQVEYATKAANALMQVVTNKPKKVLIRGEQYLEYEDWQTVGRFYGATAGTEWTKPIMRGEKVHGYESRAVVYQGGQVISAAEAMCTRDERNWADRDEFMLRSMAQTRACAKALRNVFAWVVVMAGLKPTPAEEMDGIAATVAAEENKANAPQLPKAPTNKPQTDLFGKTHTPEQMQKFTIVGLIKDLEVEYSPTPEGYAKAVSDLAQLDLVPANYDEIIGRLEVRLAEKYEQEAQK